MHRARSAPRRSASASSVGSRGGGSRVSGAWDAISLVSNAEPSIARSTTTSIGSSSSSRIRQPSPKILTLDEIGAIDCVEFGGNGDGSVRLLSYINSHEEDKARAQHMVEEQKKKTMLLVENGTKKKTEGDTTPPPPPVANFPTATAYNSYTTPFALRHPVRVRIANGVIDVSQTKIVKEENISPSAPAADEDTNATTTQQQEKSVTLRLTPVCTIPLNRVLRCTILPVEGSKDPKPTPWELEKMTALERALLADEGDPPPMPESENIQIVTRDGSVVTLSVHDPAKRHAVHRVITAKARCGGAALQELLPQAKPGSKMVGTTPVHVSSSSRSATPSSYVSLSRERQHEDIMLAKKARAENQPSTASAASSRPKRDEVPQQQQSNTHSNNGTQQQKNQQRQTDHKLLALRAEIAQKQAEKKRKESQGTADASSSKKK